MWQRVYVGICYLRYEVLVCLSHVSVSDAESGGVLKVTNTSTINR